MLQRASLLVVVVLSGCGGCPESFVERGDARTLSPEDGGARDAAVGDAARPDAAAPDASTPDAGTPDAAVSCTQRESWAMLPRSITTVELLDGPLPRWGTTERLAVNVQLNSACEELATVTVELNPGDATDFVVLGAWAWVRSPPCPGQPRTATWMVSVPGRSQGNTRVAVSTTDGMSLSYDRQACTGDACPCFADGPPGTGDEGSPCDSDCSCAAGLTCVGVGTMAGPRWACLRSCVDALDCLPGESCPATTQGMGAPSHVCTADNRPCTQDAECPAAYRCDAVSGKCLDPRPAPASSPCRCDGECGLGQHCSVALAAQPTCDVWCQRAADCPQRDQGIFTCSHANTCVPLE